MTKYAINKHMVYGCLVALFGAVVFFAAVFAPFLVQSHEQVRIVTSTFAGPCGGDNVQCVAWLAPPQMTLIQAVGVVSLLLFGILAITYAKYLHGRKALTSFLCIQVVVASVAFMTALIPYNAMRDQSQSVMVPASQLADGSWRPDVVPAYGFGIYPAMFTLFAILYLSLPILSWYMLVMSSQRVAGHKKETLFQ